MFLSDVYKRCSLHDSRLRRLQNGLRLVLPVLIGEVGLHVWTKSCLSSRIVTQMRPSNGMWKQSKGVCVVYFRKQQPLSMETSNLHSFCLATHQLRFGFLRFLVGDDGTLTSLPVGTGQFRGDWYFEMIRRSWIVDGLNETKTKISVLVCTLELSEQQSCLENCVAATPKTG